MALWRGRCCGEGRESSGFVPAAAASEGSPGGVEASTRKQQSVTLLAAVAEAKQRRRFFRKSRNLQPANQQQQSIVGDSRLDIFAQRSPQEEEKQQQQPTQKQQQILGLQQTPGQQQTSEEQPLGEDKCEVKKQKKIEQQEREEEGEQQEKKIEKQSQVEESSSSAVVRQRSPRLGCSRLECLSSCRVAASFDCVAAAAAAGGGSSASGATVTMYSRAAAAAVVVRRREISAAARRRATDSARETRFFISSSSSSSSSSSLWTKKTMSSAFSSSSSGGGRGGKEPSRGRLEESGRASEGDAAAAAAAGRGSSSALWGGSSSSSGDVSSASSSGSYGAPLSSSSRIAAAGCGWRPPPHPIPLCERLRNGVLFPLLGLGTYRLHGEECMAAVRRAAAMREYMLLDTASVYANEEEVGKAMRDAAAQGFPWQLYLEEDCEENIQCRREASNLGIFLTSKISPKDVAGGRESCYDAALTSLRRLGVHQIDLLLIHWPGIRGLKCNSKENRRLRHQCWLALEQLYKEKRVRAIGVSNFLVRHIENLIEDGIEILPMVNQIEFQPRSFDLELAAWCSSHDIRMQAYASLGSGDRSLLVNPVVQRVAAECGVTPALVLLRWGLQHGCHLIPCTVQLSHLQENTHVFNFSLSEQQMQQLDHLHDNTHFCWDPALIA